MIQLTVLIVVLVLIKKGGGVNSLGIGCIHVAITRSRDIAMAARGGSFFAGTLYMNSSFLYVGLKQNSWWGDFLVCVWWRDLNSDDATEGTKNHDQAPWTWPELEVFGGG